MVKNIPPEVKPSPPAVTLHYLGAFDGTFGFMLKEKNPKSLKDAQDMATRMEKNDLVVEKLACLVTHIQDLPTRVNQRLTNPTINFKIKFSHSPILYLNS